jgi:hypothetical protein
MPATPDTLSPSLVTTETVDRRRNPVRLRRRIAAAALAAGLLVTAACGSDKDAERDSRATPGVSVVPTGNSDEHGSATADPNVTPVPDQNGQDCQPGVKDAQGLYCEVEQFGAPVFINYENGTGVVAHLAIGQEVRVECLEPTATVPSAHGGWYKFVLAGLPDLQQTPRKYGYAAANTFENGDVVGQPINRETDPHVPRC